MTQTPTWREAKKAQTRRTIQEHALRLFAANGYDATTVNQIAAAAGVSHMTFFRYFPTKEDVVLGDDYDPMLEELIRSRPGYEPVLDSIQAAISEGFERIYVADRGRLRERIGLLLSTPALRARLWDNLVSTQQMFVRALSGRGSGPFEVQVLAGACLSALTAALVTWMEPGQPRELPDLVEDAFAVLRDRMVPTAKNGERQP